MTVDNHVTVMLM